MHGPLSGECSARGAAHLDDTILDLAHKAPPRRSWALLDDIKVWAGVAVVLSIVIYGEVVLHYLPINNVSPGFQLW